MLVLFESTVMEKKLTNARGVSFHDTHNFFDVSGIQGQASNSASQGAKVVSVQELHCSAPRVITHVFDDVTKG